MALPGSNPAGRLSLPGLLFDSIDFKLSKHSEAVRKPSHCFCSCSFRIRVFPSGKNILSSLVSGCVLAEE